MDINEIHTRILQLREQSPSESDLIDYVQSFLQGAGLQAQKQVFYYSDYGKSLVGVAALVLSAAFFVSAYQRRWRPAIAASLIIPLVLLFELSLRIPVVSWPLLNKGENVIVQFPVQNASQKMIVGTQCRYLDEPADAHSSLEATVSAFLLPAGLTLLAIALWQLVLYFGKFDSDDVRTIALVMGGVLVVYFALWTMISWKAEIARHKQRWADNAASMAVLRRLASDMGARDIRPENTWVTIVFFGGKAGEGAEAYIRKLSQKNSVNTYFIDCHEVGRSGEFRFLMPLYEQPKVSFPDRRFMQILASVCAASGERPPECVLSPATSRSEFAQDGVASAVLTSLPPGPPQPDTGGIAESGAPGLLPALRLLKSVLLKIDADQLRGRVPPPEYPNR